MAGCQRMVREINTFISKRINSRKETIEDTSDGPVFRDFGVLLSIRDLRHQTHYILQNEHLHRLALNDDTTGRASINWLRAESLPSFDSVINKRFVSMSVPVS